MPIVLFCCHSAVILVPSDNFVTKRQFLLLKANLEIKRQFNCIKISDFLLKDNFLIPKMLLFLKQIFKLVKLLKIQRQTKIYVNIGV